jgi:hypothetical protein
MDELDWSEAPQWAGAWDTRFECWSNKSDVLFAVWNTDRYIKRPTPTPHKYHRTIIGLCGTAVQVDVDRVLEAYKPAHPQLAHAAKKALCAGTRGHKSLRQDILDIIESAENALVLHDQLEALK